MNTKKLQLVSIFCLVLSVIIEVTDSSGWFDFGNPELPWGISLGLVLAALSFNIKVIRDFEASKKERTSSQRFALVLAVYAFMVFGLELL